MAEIEKSSYRPRILLVHNDDSDGKAKKSLDALRGDYNVISSSFQQFLINKDKIPDIIVLEETISSQKDIYKLCKTLKQDDELNKIPIVIISAFAFEEDRLKGFEAGCIDYIAKPFSNVELITRIKAQAKIKIQMDQLAQQKEHITDSINYAQSIQKALMPLENDLFKEHPDSFLIYMPKDTLSGDFYWSRHFKTKSIYVAADCTGHGVPGALISMLGLAFFNENIVEESLTSASDILEALKINILNALYHENKNNSACDGMDLTLIILDREKRKIQFSGANNPIFIAKSKNKKAKDFDNQLIKLKGNRQPIGYHPRTEKFKNINYNLEKDDVIYMFSDGFMDQFGGKDGKKLKSKPLQKILFNISDQKMTDQKKHLESHFDEWKGEHEQVDDILLMGIRIN